VDAGEAFSGAQRPHTSSVNAPDTDIDTAPCPSVAESTCSAIRTCRRGNTHRNVVMTGNSRDPAAAGATALVISATTRPAVLPMAGVVKPGVFEGVVAAQLADIPSESFLVPFWIFQCVVPAPVMHIRPHRSPARQSGELHRHRVGAHGGGPSGGTVRGNVTSDEDQRPMDRTRTPALLWGPDPDDASF
jgi:hypothetical protein